MSSSCDKAPRVYAREILAITGTSDDPAEHERVREARRVAFEAVPEIWQPWVREYITDEINRRKAYKAYKEELSGQTAQQQ